MFDDFCVFLDAGHGGIDPSGRYVTAPSKMFEHSQGEFHRGTLFFEGVFNRSVTRLVARKLANLNINNLFLSHEYLDLPLQYRVEKANWYQKNYKPGILISSHANSSPSHTARGFEVYTTRGVTQSDRLADMLYRHVENLLGQKIRMRPDLSDGDYDKEARFYIIQKTVMPAILIEHLFFDNYSDASLLMAEGVVELFAEAQVRTVIEYFSAS